MSGNGNMVGADLDRLQKMVNDFLTHRGDLDRIFKALDTMSANSHEFWTGPNAERFRSEWNGLRSHFQNIVNLVDSAHKATKTQHANISAAVGAGGR